MHLKIKPNPDMVITGQPELLARLVWDRDFRNSSWLSYKNASRSWAATLSTALLWVLKRRRYCWETKPHWWHLVFSQITVEKTLKGTQETSPPTGGPGRRGPVSKAAVYAQGLAFPQLHQWRRATETTLLPSCQWGRRLNLRELTSADNAQTPTTYRLCHFPSNLVTNSCKGYLCKEVYLRRKQITALDKVTHNLQVDYICCELLRASDNIKNTGGGRSNFYWSSVEEMDFWLWMHNEPKNRNFSFN